ncbi:hypothetical protein D1814_16905 [Alteromonas sp. BL110]|uniref:hypothetical protein n=1 Tax=Alteromonas sp. BL110 TaxID=1714845 RepID=UPI000E4CA310|nr:hypothetical protein [Alteromonas sp. BL110]AXT40232.1 hypothetical protein D1814_16905 [Alteromonas sp. BL110]RKM79464.1 hypothetical protein D7031_10900 [Alteromonas sp. BL110]
MSNVFKDIKKLPFPHTARSFPEMAAVFAEEDVRETVASFEAELARVSDRVRELEYIKEGLAKEVSILLRRYGDIWYDGFQSAKEEQSKLNLGCITDISDDVILSMSEAAETKYLKKASSKVAELPMQKALNKFAIEKKIEALHSAASDLEEIKSKLGEDIVRSSLAVAIGYLKSKAEQLHKEQEE